MSLCNNFFYISWNFNNPLNFNIIENNFFFNNFNLFNFSLNVRNNFFNLFNNFLGNNFNFLFWYLLDFGIFDSYFNNLFNFLDNLNNFLNISLNWDYFFNDSVNWNWYLDWDSIRSLSFEEFRNFMNDWNNSIDKYFLRNLYSLFNNSLIFLLNYIDSFNNLFNLDNFLNRFFNDLRLSNIGVNWNFYFLDSVLIEWYLYHFLNLDYLSIFNNSVNNFLNDLRNFHNFLDNSRDNNYFFDNLLDLNDFGNFHHLFNDFVNIYSHLFYPFNSFRNLNNFFNKNLNWIINIDINSCRLFYFNDFRNFNNFGYDFFDFNYSWIFDFFNDNLCDNLRNSYNFFLNNWNLNFSINNFLDLFYHFNRVINYSLYLFDSILKYDFFLYNLNFFD